MIFLNNIDMIEVVLCPSGSHGNTWRDGDTWAAGDPSKFTVVVIVMCLTL